MNRRNFLKATFTMLALSMFDKTLACHKKEVSLHQIQELSANHELVVAYNNGKKVLIYDEKGLKPVFKHLEKHNFKNTYVYDKITGKASALLLAYGKAERLYTKTLSKEAIPILNYYNIDYYAEELTDNIQNWTKTGQCPMEQAVKYINDPKEAYTVLKEKLTELSAK